MKDWALSEARKRFSAVVNAALTGVPQRITRRGKPAVVVLSVDDYERLCHTAGEPTPTFIDHLLAVPQGEEEFKRTPIALRDLDF